MSFLLHLENFKFIKKIVCMVTFLWVNIPCYCFNGETNLDSEILMVYTQFSLFY